MSLAKIGLNAGLKYAGTKITNTPIENFINSQAIVLAKELGELKGSIMKAGQMLSIYGEHFLPPEANKVLKTLQSDATPLAWPVMREQLISEIGDELYSELEINPEPIGSASIGQVYSAVIKNTGEKIALKIQFPALEEAVDSDVSALKKIISVSKVIPSEIDLTEVFEEIKLMLRQELDYEHEARQTKKYADLVGDDIRYKVPAVFGRYCTRKVLATELVTGLKPDHELVQALPDTRRNRLAENFLDLYFKEIFSWNQVQTDPHLGNYKVQIDSHGKDVLVLLDFGAVKHLEHNFISSYRKMIKGAITADETLFFAGAKSLGFINNNDQDEYINTFKAFCYQTVEPFMTYDDPRNTQRKISVSGEYDWKKTDLPERVIKNALQFRKFNLRTPPRDIIFLDRKTAGVFMFLHTLGARINARQLVSPYLASV